MSLRSNPAGAPRMRFFTINALSGSDSGGGEAPHSFIALQCTVAHRWSLNILIESLNLSIKPITIFFDDHVFLTSEGIR